MLPDIEAPIRPLQLALIGKECFCDRCGDHWMVSVTKLQRLYANISGWQFRFIGVTTEDMDLADRAATLGFGFFDRLFSPELPLEFLKARIRECGIACATSELRTLGLQFPVRDPDSAELFISALETFSMGEVFSVQRYLELTTAN